MRKLLGVLQIGICVIALMISFSLFAQEPISKIQKQDNERPSRVIHFAGRDWNVKNGTGMGPGPNNWSDSLKSVWIDTGGKLHMKIRHIGTQWYCAEISSVIPTTYGMHRFYLDSRIDSLDKNVVAAPFLYKTDTQEIDIEFAKWGNQTAPYGNYTIQPSNSSNHHTFPVVLNGGYSTHYFNWQPGSILFKSFHGHYEEPPNGGYLIDSWNYTGADNPPESENLLIHINLWLYQGHVPSNGQEVELVISGIDYPIPVPKNVTITKSSDIFQLNWSTVLLASSYNVYASNTQSGTFQLLTNTAQNQCFVNDTLLILKGLNTSRVFFHVKSVH
jgi:hypothetical protein